MNGRITVTVLAFANAALAENELAKLKAHHGGNVGFKLIREGGDDLLIEEVNGLYAAVIVGADLVLIEDRSRMQRKQIDAITESIVKKTR